MSSLARGHAGVPQTERVTACEPLCSMYSSFRTAEQRLIEGDDRREDAEE